MSDQSMGDPQAGSTFSGLSAIGGIVSGILGILVAILAIVNASDYIGAGISLLAAGVAFGLLANALNRR